MMEPVNKAARSKAFTSFFFLFLSTLVLVAALVFFSVQVPFTDNAKLRREMVKMDKERLQAEQFTSALQEAMDLMAQMNLTGANPLQIDAALTTKLNSLHAIGDNDSSMLKKLYSNVITAMFQLQAANTRLRSASNTDQNIEALKAELNQWKIQANLYQQQNDQLRMELSRR